MGTSIHRLTGGVTCLLSLANDDCGHLFSFLGVLRGRRTLHFCESFRTTSRRNVMSNCREGICRQRGSLPAADTGRPPVRQSRAQCGEKRVEHSARAKAAKEEK